MPKDNERQLAYYYYVEKQKTAKETAELVGVTPATMSKWIARCGWKAQREARALSPAARIENIRSLIANLAEERVALGRELEKALAVGDPKQVAALRCQMAAVDDGAAKWNKTLENAQLEGKIRLTTYLDVMERIFNALRDYDAKLYLQTVGFQEQHVHDISDKADRL